MDAMLSTERGSTRYSLRTTSVRRCLPEYLLSAWASLYISSHALEARALLESTFSSVDTTTAKRNMTYIASLPLDSASFV